MDAMKRTLMATLVAGVFGAAWANPTTPTIVSGAALMSNPSASVMQVVNTPGTIINWQGFSIANGETARFVQLNAASAVLNRAVGGSPSAILGRLESNGRVFLINPNGIVFGGSSVVDVAGLIASTRDISDANFLAGNDLFNGFSNGAITVQNGAQILTSTYGPGGQVWLFAKNVTNEAGAAITAPQGQVILAAGRRLEVATNSLGQMSFAVTTDGTNTVDSLGAIAAGRGAVGLFADYVNHKGSIDAPNGTVVLHGGAEVNVDYDAIINADGADGKISFESNNLLVAPSDNIHAAGGNVTFRQYQPSQYTQGATQQVWVTPADHTDKDIIVYRSSNGDYVLRFSRIAPSGDAVGLFEVTLDGRTGALLSGPTAIAAGSAEATAYNSARATYNRGNPAVPSNIQATYDASEAAAWDAYNSGHTAALAPAVRADAEWRAANNVASGMAVAAGDQYLASVNEAFSKVSNSALGYSVAFPSLSEPLSEFGGYAYSPAERTSLLASAVAARDNAQTAINNFLTPFVQAKDATLLAYQRTEQQLLDTRRAAISAAGSSYGAAYNSFRDATQATLLASEAAYYSTITAGVPVFYSDSIASSTGLVSTVRTSDGSLLSAHQGGEGNAIFLPDGSYLAGSGNQGTTVRALNDTVLLTLPSVPFESRLVPSSSGGFSQLIQDSSNGQNSLIGYTKTVVSYAPGTVIGAAGAAAAFATAPGAAPLPVVVSGRPGGGAVLDDSSSTCNSAICTGSAGVARRLADAQNIIDANRPRSNDIGNTTLRDFLDSLIAADKAGQGSTIDDQSAIIAVQALFRAAGRGGTVSNEGAAMLQDNIQDNGELRQLILGWGDLGSMTPEGRVHVLEQWLQVQNVNQRVGGSLTADQISVVDVVSHMTTRDEMSIFMDTVVNAARGWLQ